MSPRLKRGDIAPGIQKKKEKSQNSISAIFKALNEAKANPSNADGMILEASRTQSSLEKLNIPEKGIYKMSPNTFKDRCDEMFPDGFNEFKALREDAYQAYSNYINKLSGPRVNSKEWLTGQLREQKEENCVLHDSIVEFSFMYLDLYKAVKDLAIINETVKKKYEEHIVRFKKARNGLRLVVDK